MGAFILNNLNLFVLHNSFVGSYFEMSFDVHLPFDMGS